MYYLYELINLMGTVEYVGQSKRPKVRLRQHTKIDPIGDRNFHGRFYKRQDIFMNIVASYETKEEVLKEEWKLQEYWGLKKDSDHSRGSNNWCSKLSDNDVIKIKSLLRGGKTCIEISKIFNVHQKIISNIKIGRNWTHIK